MNQLHKKQNKDVKHSQEGKLDKKTPKVPVHNHALVLKQHVAFKLGMAELTKLATINMMRSRALKAEFEKQSTIPGGSWFDVKDKKVAEPTPFYMREVKLLEDELKQMRATARALLGTTKVFRMNVFYSWLLSIQITTGQVSGVQTVDPSSQSEWVAAASLFDEYKVSALDVKFRMKQAVNYSSTVYPFGVICYDPNDVTAITTVFIGQGNEQHLLFVMPSTYEAYAGHNHLDFKVRVPTGLQDNQTGTVGTGNWLPVASPLPYGYLKLFALGDNLAAVTNGGMGANVTCHCEFRIRE
jgi:hypothetical protein